MQDVQSIPRTEGLPVIVDEQPSATIPRAQEGPRSFCPSVAGCQSSRSLRLIWMTADLPLLREYPRELPRRQAMEVLASDGMGKRVRDLVVKDHLWRASRAACKIDHGRIF